MRSFVVLGCSSPPPDFLSISSPPPASFRPSYLWKRIFALYFCSLGLPSHISFKDLRSLKAIQFLSLSPYSRERRGRVGCRGHFADKTNLKPTFGKGAKGTHVVLVLEDGGYVLGEIFHSNVTAR